ncbi:hypothetical protein ACKGJO_11105 [Gracilimonas sp. Q87]|uniref:hypothetical protein n=1 Tax=Gracilimonas sp. Q87 TaxID=3384766 RepID=UPI0039841A4F
MMKKTEIDPTIKNLIRISLLLMILPALYLGLWIWISGSEELSYFEQVQLLMSYIPEPVRDPFLVTISLFGMSLVSAVFGLYGYIKSEADYPRKTSLFIMTLATIMCIWFGRSVF